METITINLKSINNLNLSLKNYLNLYYLYVLKNDRINNEEFIKAHGPIPFDNAKLLEALKYIKLSKNYDDGFELREPTLLLFEGKKDLFYTWLLGFPIKTPSGRYLSPKDEDTIKGKKLKSKWKKLFGRNVLLQQRVIDILAAELKWRKDTGKIEFMHNAETWLNKGEWETYEYLIDEQEKQKSSINEDFI